MPFSIENVDEIVLALVLIVLLGTGLLVAIAITRRQRRERYFQTLDEFRRRYRPILLALLARTIEYEQGLAALNGICESNRTFILEQLLLEETPKPTQVPILRRLSEDLGLVAVWQRRLTGHFEVGSVRDAMARPGGLLQRIGPLRFLVRAKSAENLGLIRHQPSWPVLVKALDDPHPDVQSIAARSLAAIRDPHSFPVLVERLHTTVLNPSTRLSLRSVKTALVRFPLSQAGGLLPSLKNSHPRIRSLATDIIREMVERQAALEENFVLEAEFFAPELAELFLAQLCLDENPDVRARAAPVIAYLRDGRSTSVLVTLLEDAQWFVRLHAVRALAKRNDPSQALQIRGRLTDSNWRVREAAARMLLTFRPADIDKLLEHFLITQDRYSREQVAEELQRAGVIPTFLTRWCEKKDGRDTRVIEQLAEIGKTSHLLAVLLNSSDHNLREKFLKTFGQHSDPQIQALAKELAMREADPELRALAQTSMGPGSGLRRV